MHASTAIFTTREPAERFVRDDPFVVEGLVVPDEEDLLVVPDDEVREWDPTTF